MLIIVGETYLWFEKEKSRAGEVQICLGLQDQRTKEADWAKRKWYKSHEGADTRGNPKYWAG